MTSEQWQQVWAVFQATAELPPAQRASAIESALPDHELRSKLDQLFADHGSGAEESAMVLAPALPEWPRLGQKLGRFDLRSPLGRGGMGEVYRAFDPELQREVAIKCIAPANLGSSDAIAGFLREARAASALNHPGIVTVFDVIRADDAVSIVMELVEGESFRKLAGVPQPVAQVAHWGHQITAALAASHARGIIHRDIKPENLILRRDGHTKILDFGLAADRDFSVDALPMGTVRYMSPEQARAAAITPASDIFSLGVVLFELSTGVHPFLSAAGNDNTLSVVQAIAGCDPDPPSQRGLALPAGFEALLGDMLRKDPQLRPSAAQVAVRLASFLEPKTTESKAKRLPWIWIAAGAAVAAMIVARSWSPSASLAIDPNGVKIAPFTTYQGSATQPAFSPDGSKIAFVWTGKNGNNKDIYVKAIGEDQPRRLTSDPNEDLLPVFSPDGSQIAFLRQTAASSDPEVMIMHSDGSGAHPLCRIAPPFGFFGLAWWPDGKSLVVRDLPGGEAASLFRIHLGDGSRERVTSAPLNQADARPLFSPDGKWLAFARFEASGAKICVRGLTAGARDRCLADSPSGEFAWTPDSRNILYIRPQGLWIVNLNGVARPSKVLAGAFPGFTLDHSGHRFAFIRSYSDLNLWRVSRDGKDLRRLIASSGEDDAPDWSPDGKRIVVRSNRTGAFELYTYSADGSDEKQITHFGAHIDDPRWSPDGKWIVFDGNRSTVDPAVKHHNIYIVPADGGPFRQLTDDARHYSEPTWSTDGKWIYFERSGGPEDTWKIPAAGGTPIQVDPGPMQDLSFSADGKYLYYVRYTDSSGIRRRDLTSGADEIIPGTEGVQLFRYWSVARDGIFFIPGPPDLALRFFDFQARKVRRITSIPAKLFKGPRGLAASPDGKWVLYSLQDVDASDIMVGELL